MNSLNNVNTQIINTEELTLKNVNITSIIKSETITEDNNKLATLQYIKDYVDTEDNNYAKLNLENTFLENNTFNKDVNVKKYTNDTLTSTLTISGDKIDTSNSNNTLTLKNSTLTSNNNNDTLTTYKVAVTNFNINNSTDINGIAETDNSTYTSSNDKLPTKGYVDALISDCVKVNVSNTFLEKDSNNNDLTQTFNSNVLINKGISTSANKDLTLTSSTKQINLVENTTITSTAISGSSPVEYEDTISTTNLTLTKDLEVYGDSTLNGDILLGKKETNKTSLITDETDPDNKVDTLTTDNIIVRNTLTINGDIDVNLPKNYNYATLYLENENNKYYIYNDVIYILKEDELTHEKYFNVKSFSSNQKNSSYIIEDYLYINENSNINKYYVKDIDTNFPIIYNDESEESEEIYSYTLHKDIYIYCPNGFKPATSYKIIKSFDINSEPPEIKYNIYFSVMFDYNLTINSDNYDDTDGFYGVDFNLYYIIRNPPYEINPIKYKLMDCYMISCIGSNNSLYIINLANISNFYLGYYIFYNPFDSSHDLYQLTSNIEILKGKIIEEHYNMYLLMQYNRINYLQKRKFNDLIYIKQYNSFNTLQNDYEITLINNDNNKIANLYLMNNNYNIKDIYYDNSTNILKINILPTIVDMCRMIKEDWENHYNLLCNYTNYTLDDLKQCYLIDNKIYLLFSANTNSKRLLFIFDIDDFTYYKIYEFNNNSEYNLPDKLIFYYNKGLDIYEPYVFYTENNSGTINYKFIKLVFSENDNNNHLGNFEYDYLSDYNYNITLDTNEIPIDVCFVKPYIILLSKNTTTNNYKVYYSTNLEYWQYYTVNLTTLTSPDEYHFNMGKFSNDNTYDIKYYVNLYINNNDRTKGIRFNNYNMDTLLMRI